MRLSTIPENTNQIVDPPNGEKVSLNDSSPIPGRIRSTSRELYSIDTGWAVQKMTAKRAIPRAR
jgi:hypothetical protein